MTGTSRKGRTHSSVGRKVGVSTTEDTAQLLEMAFGLHQAGELARARSFYERIIEQQPGHADALHFLGLACFQDGDPGRAETLIRRAIEAKPGVAPYHDNLGSVLEAGGALDEALDAYRQAMGLAGEDAERSFNMGVVLARLGRIEEAEAAYRRAIAQAPDDGGFHYNLATLLKGQERLEEALEHYRRAVALEPAYADARNNLGNTLQALGRLDEAVGAYQAAIESRPDDAIAHVNLGNVRRAQSQLDAAAACFANALAIDPGLDDVRLALGEVQRALGRFDAALATLEALLERQPGHAAAHRELASVLRYVPVPDYRPALAARIATCFGDPGVQAQDLAAVTAEQLRARYALDDASGDVLGLMDRVGEDVLLSALLTRTINVDAKLERFLVRMRAELANEAHAAVSGSRLRLAVAIALQGFINEYVAANGDDPANARAKRRARVERRLAEIANPDDAFRVDCALLAMSEPLLAIEGGERLGAWGRAAWGEELWPLIERTVCEPLEERALAESIDTLGDIENATSIAVRAQYEQHPYPRWLELPRREPVGYTQAFAKRFRHFTPPDFLSAPARVLVAGCGTGQEAIAVATARPGSEVLGLDLSRRSLAYARRMATKLDVANVRFVHGDILAAGRLGQRFHVIESTGVLHHMDEPIAGWRALRACLEPRGLMKIGLYSEHARRGVVSAREAICSAALEPVEEDIRKFRQTVLSAGPGSPLAELAESEDLYTMSACRDLLFHAQEHRFSLSAVASILEELDFDFIGFEPAFPGVIYDYAEFNPADPAATDLSAWERFEKIRPELFAALYVFWCQRRT